ncbi:MAG TPA: DUF418 domain-containing protein [Burkholderiaceae bacterium]|nr:DUF418 domain-containing protein [Burkholderiaceae bacterium]
MSPAAARDPRLDALRGAALLGILLVNIQSWASGAPNAIGFLDTDAGAADLVAYFITATFVAGKFMPLFGMLFGAGFALLYSKLRASYAEPRRLYRRRLLFLAAFGMLHALLLYFGDITLAYAVAGLVLLHHADSEVPKLARATARWWILAAAWLLISILPFVGSAAEDTEPLIDMVESNLDAVLTLGYAEQWFLRLKMGLWQMQANFLGLPSIIALMMTGALAQRAGWLGNACATVSRGAMLLGIGVGLPAALAYGAWAVTHAALEQSLAVPPMVLALQALSVVLSFFYATTFLQRAPDAVVAWLAPAGRMPLSNYLLQSIAMALLLPAWGAGLAASLGYAELSLLAVAVFVIQVQASRWWLARHALGPLETLWRAWTYRGAVRQAG